eukprot:jgi/Antlo1/1253/2317
MQTRGEGLGRYEEGRKDRAMRNETRRRETIGVDMVIRIQKTERW